MDGKVALITGGSRGIGRGCAIAMGRAGANVVVNYRQNKDAALEVVRTIEEAGGKAMAFQADVSDRQAVDAMVEGALKRFGPIDVLVSNAVSSTRKSFLETDVATLQRTFDVGFMGSFHVCQATASQMVSHKRQGSIIVIGSLHAKYALRNAFDYNITKAAVHHMAMTMANELVPHRIRVNLLIPGWVDTPGERQWVSEEELQAQGKQLPWGRLATPEDIANVALFLASDAAAYVSGASYLVDGALEVSMPAGGSSRART